MAATSPSAVRERLNRADSAEMSSPLSSALPAHLRKRLASRDPSSKSVNPARGDKENGGGAVAASPSRCVREVERMAAARAKRRSMQDKTRAEHVGESDEKAFQNMIGHWRATEGVDDAAADVTADDRLRVTVRKRPLLGPEVEADEFDVLSFGSRAAVLHETRRRVDLQKQLENHTFGFDACFDEATSNEAVSGCVAATPLITQ